MLRLFWISNFPHVRMVYNFYSRTILHHLIVVIPNPHWFCTCITKHHNVTVQCNNIRFPSSNFIVSFSFLHLPIPSDLIATSCQHFACTLYFNVCHFFFVFWGPLAWRQNLCFANRRVSRILLQHWTCRCQSWFHDVAMFIFIRVWHAIFLRNAYTSTRSLSAGISVFGGGAGAWWACPLRDQMVVIRPLFFARRRRSSSRRHEDVTRRLLFVIIFVLF